MGLQDESQQVGENAASPSQGGGLANVDVEAYANPTSTYQTCRLIPQALIWIRVLGNGFLGARQNGREGVRVRYSKSAATIK